MDFYFCFLVALYLPMLIFACPETPAPSPSPVQPPVPRLPFQAPAPQLFPVEGPPPQLSPLQPPVPRLPFPAPAPQLSPVEGPAPRSAPGPSVSYEPSASPVESPVPMNEPNVWNGYTYTGNPIDYCWRNDKNWAKNRKRLARCGVGFGKRAIGGQRGKKYIVTSPKDDPENPKLGTLRYGVSQDEPLWIIFSRAMSIKLKEDLKIKSFKTIDGRGFNVEITSKKDTCLSIKKAKHVIIHGLNIHDCDEDAVTISNSSHVWVDHCSLSNCGDGLIDVIDGSTGITISNNYMTKHDKVMLLGKSDDDVQDKNMQVTIAFNHFGEGLAQRMPRCRHGYFHVVNNDYTHWKNYVIGGSAAPTINCQGNRFLETDERSSKLVTKRMKAERNEWETWNWRSEGDLFLNGTRFDPSGSSSSSSYAKATSLQAQPSSQVPILTRDAGVLHCRIGKRC